MRIPLLLILSGLYFTIGRADTLTMRRTSIAPFSSLLLSFDNGSALTAAAGLKIHSDLTENHFIQLETFICSPFKKSGEELLFSNQTFTPARFVDFQYKSSYAGSAVRFGTYFFGQGDEFYNVYFSVGAGLSFLRHEIEVETYQKENYEGFVETGTYNYRFITGSACLGLNNLLSKHLGLFAETKLDLALTNSGPVKKYSTYSSPIGHFWGINLGLRIYLYSQEHLLW